MEERRAIDRTKERATMETTRNIIAEIIELLNLDIPFSDILVEQDAPVMVRGPAGWEMMGVMEIPSYDDIAVIFNALDPNWEVNILKGAINRPMDIEPWRLRVNGYLAFSGGRLMMSIRRLPLKQPTLKAIGLSEHVRLMIDSSRGFILVAGATGSGKSTTVGAMVDCINESRPAHVITIEDPIEYKFVRNKAIFSQREVGVDCPTFYEGVRDAMRQRPDVIVIGEIRDRETAEAALLAAESGHLVIATVHANTAAGSVQKMLSFFTAADRDSKLQALSTTLVGAISQILLPHVDKQNYVLAAELLFNNKQQCSKHLGETEKLNAWLDRKEDKISRTMIDSLEELVVSGKVSKSDALRAVTVDQPALSARLKAVT
ncbi:MAG: ATPase, T2SS/T4P/T4SS family [Sulfuritalea sp.]|nr:ATPase, T2SS/T4P/T4SS family [Sulfuritalea sp.]